LGSVQERTFKALTKTRERTLSIGSMLCPLVFIAAAPLNVSTSWTRALQDVDGDSDMSLLFHFKRQVANLVENRTGLPHS